MKLTKKDYQWCYNKMKYWQKELGVMNMELTLVFDHMPNRRGQCSYNLDAMHATIYLNNEVYFDNKTDIEKTIFHEVCEAMMSEIYIKMENHNITENEQERLGHSIIRRLENLLFK